MRFTKWGGNRHWYYKLEELGTDEYGWWLGGRQGISLRRGEEKPVSQPHDFVALVPDCGRWLANWSGGGNIDTAVYVDVTDVPVRRAGTVEAVDLDLDVVQMRDGRVLVLDKDEFEEHQRRYSYPPELIAQALATTDDLVTTMSAGAEPFGRVGLNWLAEFVAAK